MTSGSNLWHQKLQASFNQSLQTVNSTVSSFSDGAARLKALSAAQHIEGTTGAGIFDGTGSTSSQQPSSERTCVSRDPAQSIHFDLDTPELVQQHAQDRTVPETGNTALSEVISEQSLAESEKMHPRCTAEPITDGDTATELLATAQAEIQWLRRELQDVPECKIVLQIKEQEAAESVACQETSDGNKATIGGPEQPPSPPDNNDNAITQLQERLLRSTAQTASLKAELAQRRGTMPMEVPPAAASRPDSAEGAIHDVDLSPEQGHEAVAGASVTTASDRLIHQPHIDSLMDKIRRLEAEKHSNVDELTDANTLAADLQRRLQEAHAALDATQGELRESQATAERRLQELRSRVGASSAQSSDMLRQAQEICDEAEGRASASEGKALELLSRCQQLEAELASVRQERDDAKDGAVKSASAASASAEQQAEQLRRLLSKAEDDKANLERQLAAATDQESAYLNDIRELEGALADKEALAMRAAALEERVEETRGERNQLASYKQLAADAEAARSRVEGELMVTARMASSMESRLRESQAAADAARSAVAVSERRAFEAEQQVQIQVAEQLEAIGGDRTRWPAVARREVEALDARVASLSAVVSAGQAASEEASAASHTASRIQEALQRRADDAESRATRARNEASRQAAETARQLGELKGQVASLKADLEAAQGDSAAGPSHAPLSRGTPHSHWRGGGSLLETQHDKGYLHSNGSGATETGAVAATPRAGKTYGPSAHLEGSGSLAGRASSNDHISGEALAEVDVVYMKNVLLKFITAQAAGKTSETEALLPAVATLLRATPNEFRALRSVVGASTWWPALGG